MLTVTDQVNPIQHGCLEATRDLINANDPLALTEQLDKFGFYSIPSFSLELAQPTIRPGKNYFNNIQTLIPATQLSPPCKWHSSPPASPTMATKSPPASGQRLSN